MDFDDSTQSTPALKTRRPTGRTTPILLLDGDPGQWGDMIGKVIDFAADGRTGPVCWLDIGENEDANLAGAVDEGHVLLLDHDGSWDDIMARLREVYDFAASEIAAGRPPVVLMVNSISQLADITRTGVAVHSWCASDSLDPASAAVTKDEWRYSDARWRLPMQLLTGFPGIVLTTARMNSYPREDISIIDAVYSRPDLPPQFLFHVTACVHCRTGAHPTLTVAKDRQAAQAVWQPIDEFSLSAVLFDSLGIDPAVIGPRPLRLSHEAIAAQLFGAGSVAALKAMYDDFERYFDAVDNPATMPPLVKEAYEKRLGQLRTASYRNWIADATTMEALFKRRDRAKAKLKVLDPVVTATFDLRREQILAQYREAIADCATSDELDDIDSVLKVDVWPILGKEDVGKELRNVLGRRRNQVLKAERATQQASRRDQAAVGPQEGMEPKAEPHGEPEFVGISA